MYLFNQLYIPNPTDGPEKTCITHKLINSLENNLINTGKYLKQSQTSISRFPKHARQNCRSRRTS